MAKSRERLRVDLGSSERKVLYPEKSIPKGEKPIPYDPAPRRNSEHTPPGSRSQRQIKRCRALIQLQ